MLHHKILLLSFFFSLCAFTQQPEPEFSSQPQKRAEYAWVLYLSGGAGYYVSNSGAPNHLERKISNLSHVTNLRIMWHPDHLLKVGLETGHMTFYSYKFKDSAGVSGTTK